MRAWAADVVTIELRLPTPSDSKYSSACPAFESTV